MGTTLDPQHAMVELNAERFQRLLRQAEQLLLDHSISVPHEIAEATRTKVTAGPAPSSKKATAGPAPSSKKSKKSVPARFNPSSRNDGHAYHHLTLEERLEKDREPLAATWARRAAFVASGTRKSPREALMAEIAASGARSVERQRRLFASDEHVQTSASGTAPPTPAAKPLPASIVPDGLPEQRMTAQGISARPLLPPESKLDQLEALRAGYSCQEYVDGPESLTDSGFMARLLNETGSASSTILNNAAVVFNGQVVACSTGWLRQTCNSPALHLQFEAQLVALTVFVDEVAPEAAQGNFSNFSRPLHLGFNETQTWPVKLQTVRAGVDIVNFCADPDMPKNLTQCPVGHFAGHEYSASSGSIQEVTVFRTPSGHHLVGMRLDKSTLRRDTALSKFAVLSPYPSLRTRKATKSAGHVKASADPSCDR